LARSSGQDQGQSAQGHAGYGRRVIEVIRNAGNGAGYGILQGQRIPKEFEDSFDYNETDDQLSAIRAIKYDMESTTPMDRLLCGDVGYGKTEVAMRAAFKAVQDGKQVAILTPTTILSFQHFETFKNGLHNSRSTSR